MPQFSIKDLAKIIERDSKDATYKYGFHSSETRRLPNPDHRLQT